MKQSANAIDLVLSVLNAAGGVLSRERIFEAALQLQPQVGLRATFQDYAGTVLSPEIDGALAEAVSWGYVTLEKRLMPNGTTRDYYVLTSRGVEEAKRCPQVSLVEKWKADLTETDQQVS